MPAVPMPDQDTTKVLTDARDQAAASLRGKFPDSMLTFPPIDLHPAPKVNTSVTNIVPAEGQQTPTPTPPAPEPGPGAAPVVDYTPGPNDVPPEPGPGAKAVDEKGNLLDGTHPPLYGLVGPGGALANQLLNVPKSSVVGNIRDAVMRGTADVARTLGFAAAGLAGTAGMGEGGGPEVDSGEAGQEAQTKIFDYIQNHVERAYDQYKSPENSNTLAKVAGGVTEGALPLLAGGVGIPTIVANSVIEKGKESVDAGDNAKLAATLAFISGITTLGQVKVGFKDPSFIKRVAKWVGAGDALDVAGKYTEVLARTLLSDETVQEALKKVDPLNVTNLAANSVLQAIFGALHGGKAAPLVKKVDPNGSGPGPDAVPVTAGTGEPPPPPAESAPYTPVETSGTSQKLTGPGGKGRLKNSGEDLSVGNPGNEPPPAPGPSAQPVTVPMQDTPSAEPLIDLKAQVAELGKTRDHVYLSPDNVQALGKDGVKALAGDKPISKNFDKKGGVLISNNFSVRSKAAQLRSKNGEDMQATLGALTGAGTGKAPDQTVVVQGQTPEGAVVKESMVTPAEVPAATAGVAAEGHTPVVTNTDAAVARRAELKAQEAPIPPDEANTPVSTPLAEVSPSGPKKGDMRIIKLGTGEEVPVVVESAEGNKVKVRQVSPDGDISKETHDVPADMFKEPTPIKKPADIEEQPSAEAAPQVDTSYKPGSPLYESDRIAQLNPTPEARARRQATIDTFNESQRALREKNSEPAPEPKEATPLEQAAQFYDESNKPLPGKKFAGSVDDHAGRVATLARALKGSLKDFPDADEQVLKHATDAANRVLNVDSKSAEAMKHNRGVGHGMLEDSATDIKQAIHNLTHPDDVMIPKPVQIKAKTLAIKKAKEAAPAAEPKTVEVKLKEKQAEKVKTAIPDVKDETKPKVLNAGDKARIAAALEKYSREDPDTVGAAYDNLQRVLHEAFGDSKTADDYLQLAREQREDDRAEHEQARRSGRMSDTVSEEDLGPSVLSKKDLRGQLSTDESAGKPPTGSSPLRDLHQKLAGSLYARLRAARESGGFVGTHDVLEHMMGAARDNPIMFHLLAKLREHVPDLPIRPTSGVVDPLTGEGFGERTAGILDPRTNTIQVRVGDADDIRLTHTLIHEPVHAATSYEYGNNPNGEFAQTINKLHAEAVRRAGLLGLDESDHYGLTNPKEFIAEAVSNPVFQKFLADSESVVKPRFSAAGDAIRNLYDRVAGSIAKLLGVKNPAEARLLRDSLTAVQRGMELQSARRTDLMANKAPDFLNANPAVKERLAQTGLEGEGVRYLNDQLLSIDKMVDPPPLQHEDRFRAVAGDVATAIARSFRTASRSGAVEAIRRTTRALTPYDGLVRSALRRGVFGDDAPGNPLRDMDETSQQRNAIINRLTAKMNPIVALRAKLSSADDAKLGKFQDDVGSHGFYIERPPTAQPKAVMADKKFPQKWADMQQRWQNLSPAQKEVYRQERDYNEQAARQFRKASVDLATESFTDKELSPAQRSLLYAARDPGDFEQLIGPGKMIDVGERNDTLKDALKDISSTNELEGDYFHKGRNGDYVVQVRKDSTKVFGTKAEAEAHAQSIRELSPASKAKVSEVGGKFQVDGTAEYTSMHEKVADAEEDAERLRKAGFDVGSVTQKILSADSAPLSKGFESIYSEASRKLDRRRGESEEQDKAIEDVKSSLRKAFVQQMAARSTYAGSKLARRNVGGVKPGEMGRSFAQHGQSQAWNIGHMSTVLKMGDALGRLKTSVKDDTASQSTALQRGRVYDEVQKRLRQEVAQYGSHTPLNAVVAKLGFLNYMTSASHALLYMTQNFTTAIPAAGARFGYGKSMSAFGAAMRMMSGPAFRETYRALVGKGDVDSIQRAIIGAVSKDERFGKWAQGADKSPLQQLIDRGIIHTSLSNQLAVAAGGGSKFANSIMEWARITPALADAFNRVSTGLAALELHKGDVYKAGDFVKETHVDYSQENKPRAFKAVNKLWGGNSVTMFRSYITGMTHLLYSHVYDAAMGSNTGSALGGRAEGLKTVAGLMLGTALFAGVQKGFGIEPVRIAMDVYHHLAGDNNEYYSFDNSARRAVKALGADGKLADVINGGLPRLLGVDMSGRMGLSDLFFHDPPDLLSLKPHGMMDMAAQLLGAGMQQLSDSYDNFNQAFTTGRLDDWMKVIPVKAWQNVFDAYKAGTSGKVSSTGAHLTAPSAGAAISHAIGFRTAEEAKLSEKAQTEGDYKQWVEQRKYEFLKQWSRGDADQRSDLRSQRSAFNSANPGNPITVSDLIKAQRTVLKQEREAEGLPGRNPVVNELRDH